MVGYPLKFGWIDKINLLHNVKVDGSLGDHKLQTIQEKIGGLYDCFFK